MSGERVGVGPVDGGNNGEEAGEGGRVARVREQGVAAAADDGGVRGAKAGEMGG